MRSLIFAVGLAALAATPSSAQQALTKVRVAYDGFSMTSGPLVYADKQGIFKRSLTRTGTAYGITAFA